MTLRLSLLAAALIALIVIGASAAAAANRGVPISVTWLEDPAHEPGTAVPGSFATQQRGYYSITAQLHLTGLAPGHRYTLWWIIYNNPATCVEGCDAADVSSALQTGENPAGIGVHYGGSFVAPANGKLDAATRLLENAVTGCVSDLPYKALCNPLIDAAIAEATILFLDNGPATDAPSPPVGEMFSFGCKTYMRLDVVAVTYGETGFDCFSPYSIHLP